MVATFTRIHNLQRVRSLLLYIRGVEGAIQQTDLGALAGKARLAPRYSEELALLYERERQSGNGNRATLAAARKMVALMLAVERRNTDFVPAGEFRRTAAA